MKIFMDKWRHTLVVGATAFALLLVWSIMRDSLTETMADEANSALRKHGAEIAGLKGRKSNSRNINKFVRSAKKREKSRQMLENLNGLNSALDVLKSVTSLAPSRKVSKMNVRGFSVNNDIVRIQGEMQKTQNIAAFKKNLESIARKGVKENAPTIKTTKGYRAFNFEFIVNRNSGS